MNRTAGSLPPLSPRHATGLGVLLAVALVPTIIHSYVGLRQPDARTLTAIPLVIDGYTSVSTSRPSAWFADQFGSNDAIERRYTNDGGEAVVLTAIRSYDLPPLYHHPELAVAYGVDFDRHEIQHFPDAPNVPVHVLLPAAGSRQAASMYVVHYDGRYIDDPIAFQLRTAAELLLRGRTPMTLIFARGTSSRSVPDVAHTGTARILVAALAAFDASDAREHR